MKKLVKESLYENYQQLNEGAKISNKDWDRMLDLVMKDDNGEKIAKLIKDKDKAISRFICGLKLSNDPLKYNVSRYDPYGWSSFSDIGNKAIELGATPEEIEELYNNTEVPPEYIKKISKLSDKKLNNRFVGSISKAILDMGFDIKYLPHNGNAITIEGKDAMARNGIKWTIGYKTQIDLGNKKVDFNFDAITDEGDGPTYYILDKNTSDDIFDIFRWDVKYGKNNFISELKNILNKNK